jgi:hypothetical protein
MPQISRFFGVIIYMYFDDHNPPHFHAVYDDDEAVILIETLSLHKGKLPARIFGFVIEWATLHQEELIQNWNDAQNDQPFKKIEPLK